MANQKISLNIFVMALIAFGLAFSFGTLLILPIGNVLGQATSTSTSTSSSSAVQISKDLTNTYTLSSGSSKIGTFDTKYTILGNINALKQQQKLITSTITTDFDNSPIVGYVKVSSNDQQQNPTIGNPFADKATINQKIAAEINNAITSASSLNTAKAAIDCNFGMSISQWTCKSHGLVG